MDACFDPPRGLVVAAFGLALAAAGCSDAPTPTEDSGLAVTMPVEGSVNQTAPAGGPIDPPALSEVAAADTVSGEDQGPGENRGPGENQGPRDTPGATVNTVAAVGQPPEVVPAPAGDSAAEVVPTPAGISAADSAKDGRVPVGGPPVDYKTWPVPDLALVVTGQQHGYIEPCGCTGLDKQKGGVARRFTFMQQLRDRGWPLLPIDGGNQVRRFGRQAEIKLQQSAKALDAMGYKAVGFGPDDLRLGVGELLAVAAGEDPDDSLYVSANVVLIDPDLMPRYQMVQQGGMKVGVTTILDPEAMEVAASDEIEVRPIVDSAKSVLEEMAAKNPDFRVLAFFGSEDAGKKLVQQVPGFDLMVIAGDYGEPTYQAESIDGSETQYVLTGNKGMYAGLVGLYSGKPLKYARVPLTHEFQDAPEMRRLMAGYQDQLRDVGLAGLGLKPIPHPSGRKFVGSEKCGSCHKTAFEIWEGTPHFEATDHIVKPPKERGDIARHFDPECISCHVTGWNPQNYYPYQSGYLSLEESAHLTGNGCENCHGPGLDHVNAELPDSGVDSARLKELREQMKLSYDDAREKCMECHDLDNSPDFHVDDAFEDEYWPSVEHYGVD